MDRSFRNDMLATLHKGAAAMSALASIDREYSLYEIAIMTRAAPARSLGLSDRGHLGVGAAADITVYGEHSDRERMFARPLYVFKDGELVARNGKVVKVQSGVTHVVRPGFDPAIEDRLRWYFERYQTMKLESFKLRDDEVPGVSVTGLRADPPG
jgi:formylmethanofuran dehydrogenase subunit A